VGSDSQLEGAAQVLMRAFAGEENARMGRRYARALLRTFEVEPSRALVIAVEGDRVAGFAAGEEGGTQGSRYRSLRPIAALSLLEKPWLLLDPSMFRMAVRRLTNDAQSRVPKDSWFLALMAVDPDFLRLGIGRQLLSAFEEEGCRRGFAHAALYVRDSNRAARALYEKSGWLIASEPQSGRILYTKTLAGGLQTES